jgi:hypothetical protein
VIWKTGSHESGNVVRLQHVSDCSQHLRMLNMRLIVPLADTAQAHRFICAGDALKFMYRRCARPQRNIAPMYNLSVNAEG